MASLAKQMTNPARLHSHRVDPRAPFNRVHSFIYSLAVLALLYHRALSLLASPSALVSSLLAAELVLGFIWATAQAFRWRPLRRREFPDRLPLSEDWPALDVFVCTADHSKEPPMSVVSTALSAMAFDYPADKLSVFVSDDGGSELMLFAFMEAAKFARHWLPFCRENGLEVRSPEVYFRSGGGGESEKMKKMYKYMNERVENAMQRGHVGDDLLISQDEYEIFKKWKGFTSCNHPSIIKVLLESSKDTDIMGHSLPNLVYVSREKQEAIPHHFKAGALNALIRVSGVMTDAPVILTLDCDMYSNDPKAPLRALCYLLDPEMVPKLAFVQFPQRFEGINKNDTYGSEIKRLCSINSWGMDGLTGPNYGGTNCFFLRRSFYGPPSSPERVSEVDDYRKQHKSRDSIRSESILERACQVASCTFEQNTTKWGSEIGCRYGSLVEDFYTGYHLHCQGWRSVFCDPERPAFLGDAPRSLNDVLSQVKRWCVGLFEVQFSKYNPLLYGTKRAPFLTCLCYAHYASWGIWSIPLAIYAVIPQLALMCHIPLFPKVSDPWFHLYAYLFSAAYVQDLMEFLTAGATIKQWWNDQRIWMVRGMTSFLFGFTQFVLNHIGISTSGFNVTSKVKENGLRERYERGAYEFGIASPFFVSIGTVAIVNLISFSVGVARALRKEGAYDEMFAQLFISAFVVVNCWPVYEAMFLREDEGRMPRRVTCISVLLGLFLVSMAHFISVN